MASAHDDFEKGVVGRDIESGSDSKAQTQHVDDKKAYIPTFSSHIPPVEAARTRTLEAPEFIRNMSLEQRQSIENRLRKKIDFRLLPMIVLMYIMNYIDRVSASSKEN